MTLNWKSMYVYDCIDDDNDDDDTNGNERLRTHPIGMDKALIQSRYRKVPTERAPNCTCSPPFLCPCKCAE